MIFRFSGTGNSRYFQDILGKSCRMKRLTLMQKSKQSTIRRYKQDAILFWSRRHTKNPIGARNVPIVWPAFVTAPSRPSSTAKKASANRSIISSN